MEAPSTKNLFWGVTLQPEKRYSQVPDEAFHISKACVEPSSLKKGEGKSVVSVYVEVGSDEFLICNLSTGHLNESLDLHFNRGEKVDMRIEGSGNVHLTGYLIPENAYDDSEDSDEFTDDDDEDGVLEEEEDGTLALKKLNGNAGKNNKMTPLDKQLAAAMKKEAAKPKKKPDDVTAEIKKAEEMKKKLKEQSKKIVEEEDDDDDSDDDDEDMLDDEAEEDSDEDEDEGDDDDDDDDDDDSDEDSDEEAETPAAKKKSHEAIKPSGETQLKKETDLNKSKTEKNSMKTKENKDGNAKAPSGGEVKSPKTKDDKKNGAATPGGEVKTPKKTDEKKNGTATPGGENKTPRRTLKNGLIIEDKVVGKGPEVKPGKMIGVYYVGKFKGTNKTFDSCTQGKPFHFRVGKGEVIKAWDLGFDGMRMGGKRTITAPPALAYGPRGAPPDIPPNATLVFDVECKYVK